jgi:2'-hydroxyisoflavone reductase
MRPIDARDAAAFTLEAIDRGLSGPYIVSGPEANAVTFGDFLGTCVEVTGSRAELVWLPDDFLIGRNVGFWSELPLWTPAGHPEVGHVWDLDTARAEAEGLRCRPVAATIADTWDWLAENGGRMRRTYVARDPHGLDEEREREVLLAWDIAANLRPGARLSDV